MKLQLTGWLLIALAASLAGNAFLGWQWAGAKAECRADMEHAAVIAINNERARAAKADEESVGISVITGAEATTAARKAQGATDAREQQIRTVVVRGDCRMPDGLPSLQPAIDEANAAAGL